MMTQMCFLIYYYIHGSSNVFAFNDCKLCRQNAYKKTYFLQIVDWKWHFYTNRKTFRYSKPMIR